MIKITFGILSVTKQPQQIEAEEQDITHEKFGNRTRNVRCHIETFLGCLCSHRGNCIIHNFTDIEREYFNISFDVKKNSTDIGVNGDF